MVGRANVLVISHEEEEAACYHIRILSPLRRFPSNDFRYVHLPSMKSILNLPWLPDIIYIRRNYHYLEFTNKLIHYARSKGIATIMDIDDLITDLPSEHPSVNYYRREKDNLLALMKNVDYITVSTEELNRQWSYMNKNIKVLPNYLDPLIWFRDKKREKKRRPDRKMVIGYAGSNTHVNDFAIITPAIKHILSKYKGKVLFRFLRCIPDELRGHQGVERFLDKTLGYVRYASYLRNSDFDFAIAPLEDNPFNRCKSNIKFLEYSICKIPAIYSHIRPYIDSVKDGETGILCKNDTESWVEAMESLMEKPDLRSKISERAYSEVLYNYMIDNKLETWHSFFDGIRQRIKGHEGKRFDGDYLKMCTPRFIRSEMTKLYWDTRRILRV